MKSKSKLSVSNEFFNSKFFILFDNKSSLFCRSINDFFFLREDNKPLSPSKRLKKKYNFF